MTSGATGRDAMFRRAILELRVRPHRAWLVGELAEGTPPTTSRRHWRCAEELLSRAHRAELALGLERLIQEADHPHPGLSAAIPPQRQQVRDARAALLAIIDGLRSPEPIGLKGAAIVAQLLADGAGPVYAPAPPGALADVADRALAALRAPSNSSELAAPA